MGNTTARSTCCDEISDRLPWIMDHLRILERAPTRTQVVKGLRNRKREESEDEEDPQKEKDNQKEKEENDKERQTTQPSTGRAGDRPPKNYHELIDEKDSEEMD